MTADLLSESVLVATLALVAMPLVAHRVRASFRPVELTRFNASTLGGGLALLTVALIACAIPVVLAVTGTAVADRHFFPGDEVIGWISAGAVVAIALTTMLSLRRTRRIGRRLTIEPYIGFHIPRDGYHLVVLDSDELLAYAVNEGDPQVVITTGLVDILEVGELVAVVEHETAHLELNHRIHLRLIGILEPLARLRPVGQLIAATRLALEVAADSATSDRSNTRSALLRTAGVKPAHGVAAFTAGDMMQRVEALDPAGSPHSQRARPLLYLLAFSLASISTATLVVFWL